MSAKESKLEEIMAESGQNEQKVQKILNILLEAPYFYRDDDLGLFLFLSKYKRAFAGFFKKFYGWEIVVEPKCARLYKPAWFNEKVTEANRDMFNFTRRDECVAFLLLLEFFERQLQEQAVSTDEKENLRFLFGSFLEFACARFREVFPGRAAFYTDEQVRRTVRAIMPALRKYRFLREIPCADGDVKDDDTIYECLPAMWLYKGERLARPVEADAPEGDSPAPEGTADGGDDDENTDL